MASSLQITTNMIKKYNMSLIETEHLLKLYEKINEYETKIKNLEKIPIHGQEITMNRLVAENTKYNIIKATDEQLSQAFEYAKIAQKYQIIDNNNVFLDKTGNPRKRFNECGNDMENVLKKNTNIKGFSQSAGYPDLQTNDYYLECKIAGLHNIKTTQRSFYLSTLSKITKCIPHILICFVHINGKLDMNIDPKVIDLYDLKLKLKCEWFSTNNEMY